MQSTDLQEPRWQAGVQCSLHTHPRQCIGVCVQAGKDQAGQGPGGDWRGDDYMQFWASVVYTQHIAGKQMSACWPVNSCNAVRRLKAGQGASNAVFGVHKHEQPRSS